MLKAQDILVCVYLAVSSRGETYPQIANTLKIGISTAHGAVQRARSAQLLDDVNQPIRTNLLEFLCHGLRFVFYPERGSIIRGVPTGAAAPGLREHLASTPENSPVWPASSGRARGYSLTPLYSTIPEIAPANATLHAALGAIDLLRIGTARERAFAGDFIEKLMTQKQ